MIPKIIHQIWFGDQSKRPDRWLHTWRDAHPDWEYRLWTEDNLLPLRARRAFDAMPHWCGKADIARYEILEQMGGVYIDADSECLMPLSDDLLANRAFAAHENEYWRPGLFANSVIGCEPNVPFLAQLTDHILALPNLEFCPAGDVWKLTGPLAFTRTIGQGAHSYVRIYPSFWFYPEHHSGMKYTGTVDRCYARQFWGSTKENVYQAASRPTP